MAIDQPPALHPRPTNWHVLTGAPCAGKTSVIEMLARRGYTVVHEVARAYIDRQLAEGRTLAQIKADAKSFEKIILMQKVGIETALPPDEIVFLDRAVPDSVAYYRVEGLDPEEPLHYSRLFRYGSVFFLERLGCRQDAVRWETDRAAGDLDTLIAQAYAGLGYDLIRVPVLSIAERTDYILDRLHLQ